MPSHHASDYKYYNPPSQRPLVDFPTDEWEEKKHNRGYSLSSSLVSVSDDANSDLFSHDCVRNSPPQRLPRWIRPVRRKTPVIPHNTQRRVLLALLAMMLGCAGLAKWVWPAWQEACALNKAPHDANKADDTLDHGASAAVKSDSLIQVKKLDRAHLPTAGARGRLVFVGDIHGCKHELLRLLDKLAFDRRRDHLVTVGDMVNKGPDSAGTVDVLRDLGASCVRGNHEDRVLLTRERMQQQSTSTSWPSVEAEEEFERATMSKAEARARHTARLLSDAQARWLAACPCILRVGRVPGLGEMAAVHAGLAPGVRLRHQDPFQVMNMRSIDAGTRQPSEGRAGTEWDRVWGDYQARLPRQDRMTVVYGHDSKRGLNVQRYAKGLDSGCVNGDRLTALVVGPDGAQELVSVGCGKRKGKAKAAEEEGRTTAAAAGGGGGH